MRGASISCIAVAAAAVALALASAVAAAAPPAGLVQKHTKADMKAANAVSLTLADVGATWTASPPNGAEPALTCAGWHPDLTGIVETGAGSSDSLQGGTQGPFVSESAWIYKTDAQAQQLWAKAVGAKLLDCLAETVKQGSNAGVRFKLRSKRVLMAPSPRRQRAAYRVVSTASTSGQTVDVYYDLVVVAAGRGVAEITFARVGAPMSASSEAELASIVERRLGAIRPE